MDEKEYWEKDGYKSVEDYLQWCLDQRIPLRFRLASSFRDLFEKGIVDEGMSIRTSNAGMVDQHYEVNADGCLTGVQAMVHSGLEGTFPAEEILQGERISSGWTIESTSALSFHLRNRGK